MRIGLGQRRGYHANYPNDGGLPQYELANIEDDPNILWHWKRNGKEMLGTTLGIQMDVQSFLSHYNPKSGDFGLRLIVRGDIMKTKDQVEQDVAQEYFFSVPNMYGNPYGFIDVQTQQMLINLSHFKINGIEEIAAYFYQDHNFISDEGIKIPYLDTDGDLLEENLAISNLSVGFGLTTSDIQNELL